MENSVTEHFGSANSGAIGQMEMLPNEVRAPRKTGTHT